MGGRLRHQISWRGNDHGADGLSGVLPKLPEDLLSFRRDVGFAEFSQRKWFFSMFWFEKGRFYVLLSRQKTEFA